MTPRKSPFAALRSRRGFALLITITLLAFLVLLLVSLASLSRVETQVASNSAKVAQARANALLAVNLALGQLQKFSGPDQRVTTTADFGDSAANALPVAVDGSRQWVGVWGNANAATDDRGAPRLLNWLVSGNEATALQADTDGHITSTAATPARRPDHAIANLPGATALSSNLTIGNQPARLLVGPGSVGDSTATGQGPAGYVAAPLVTLNAPGSIVPGQGGNSGVAVGRYAWWVGDEGVKARINLVEDEAAITASNDEDRRLRYRVAPRAGVELATDAFGALVETNFAGASAGALRADLRKTLASSQLSLTAGGSPFPASFLRGHYHDFTAASSGVLSNTLAGGLRKDLTAAFAQGKTRSDAPTGPIWRLGATDETTGPDWHLLRSYYQLPFSNGVSASGASMTVEPRAHVDGVTDASQPAQQGIYPVVASWQLYVEGRVSPLTAFNCGLELRYYPALVLWNPYNVTLKDHAYRVTYSIAGGDVTFIRVSARNPSATYSQVPVAVSAEAQVNTPWLNGVNVTVQSGDMEPGAAYVYTLRNNVYFSSDNFTSYPLQRGWNGGGVRSIIVGGNTFPLTGGDPSKFMVSFWRGTNSSSGNSIPSWASPTQTVPTVAPGTGQTEPAVRDDTLTLSTSAGEVLQQIRQNNNYDDAFKMRWVRNAFVYRGLDDYLGSSPAVVGYTGTRWALKTTALSPLSPSSYKNKPVRWLADYNPRAPFSARTPYEMQNTNLGVGYFHTNPSFNFQASTSSTPAYAEGDFDPVNANAAIAHDTGTGRAFVGMSQTSWSGGGGSTVPLFNLPRASHSVVSLGEFQHAQLYRFRNTFPFASNASPAYAVGNSLADPRTGLGVANHPWAEINIGNNSFSTYKSTARVFDHSYLLNHALWDGYYLSTVPRGASASEPVSFPLPNPRMIRRDHASASADADLRDYDKSAANLVVAGAFNVNSVSAEAWRGLLGGLNNLPVGSTQRNNEAPYPRNPYTIDDNAVLDAASTTDAGAEANAYAGYRFLTRGQIEKLADQIVIEVRRRGPFVSLADFVNRSLSNGASSGIDLRLRGALAQAIEDAGINAAFSGSQPAELPSMGATTSMAETAAAGTTATHVPGWVTQADLLQPLGPVLSARSDTFTIRAYGEALNSVLSANDAGYIQSRAWCEAVVQRLPEYVDATNDPWISGASLSSDNQRFGRRFKIVAFRWLTADEI